MLNLTYVRTFVSVIDEGGFHEAARRLKCSQPTVFQHIKKLEASMKTVLVTRSHARSAATPQGRQFLPYARSLLRVAARAQVNVDALGLVIGASTNVGTYLLPPYLKSFADSKTASGNVDIVIGSNPDVAERITCGEIDVALMEWWDSRPGFSAFVWRREPLVVIVPPDHPWSNSKSIPKHALFETPLIGGESGIGTATLLRQVFGESAETMPVHMTLGSNEAVKAGLGISLTLAGAVDEEVASSLLHTLTSVKRKQAHDKLLALDSKVYQAFLEMERAAFSEGAVSKKHKEWMAIGISVVIDCESCMQWHIEQAAKSGATMREVLEVVEVGMEMGGGPATVSSRFALEVMEEIFDDAPDEHRTQALSSEHIQTLMKTRY